MTVLLVLLISLGAFRGLGVLGVEIFATWAASARYALATMFLFTSTAHFTKMKHDLVRMVPGGFSHPLAVVYLTGVCEVLGAIGILLPPFRRAAGVCLMLFLVAIFPANWKAAREGVLLRGKSPTALWLRIPMQILFLVLTWWATQPAR